MKSIVRMLAMSFALLSFAGHAVDDPRPGWTGHFAETKVDDSHYNVTFGGSGNKNLVYYFMLYRCAQLTQGEGYAYFGFETIKDNLSDAGSAGDSGVATPDDTTPHGEASLAMYANDIPDGKVVLRADLLVGALGDYVNSNGNGTPPNRREVLGTAGFRMTADHRLVTLREFASMSHLAGAARIAESLPRRPDVMGQYNMHPLPNGPILGPAGAAPRASVDGTAAAAGDADVPSTLPAAQSTASQMGCNEVQPAGSDTYTAQCSSYRVLIRCDAGKCQPEHVIR